jgi:hypothetical protein
LCLSCPFAAHAAGQSRSLTTFQYLLLDKSTVILREVYGVYVKYGVYDKVVYVKYGVYDTFHAKNMRFMPLSPTGRHGYI